MSNEKTSMYISDHTLLRRIKEYVNDAGDPEKINKDSMVEDLRIKYKEYGRRQKSAFRAMSLRAFKVVVENMKNGIETEKGSDNENENDKESDEMDVDNENASEECSNSNDTEKLNGEGQEGENEEKNSKGSGKSSEASDVEITINEDGGDKDEEEENDDDPLEIDDDSSQISKTENSPSKYTMEVTQAINFFDLPCDEVNSDVLETNLPSTFVKSHQTMTYMESLQSMTNQARMKPLIPNGEPINISSEDEEKSPSRMYENLFSTKGSVNIHLVEPTKHKKKRIHGPNRPGPKCSKRNKRPQDEEELEEELRHHVAKRIKLSHDCTIPSETFSLFGGFFHVLESVTELVIHIKESKIYEILGATPPRGFLLHGPPGCGKTLLAKAIAGELEVPLVRVCAPELVAGVSGESESRIRDVFDFALASAPCILFIDEIDAICPPRESARREMERRIVAQLLTCIDALGECEMGSKVVIIGATNRPDSLDPALRRAGRFDREVCLGIPDRNARLQILQVITQPMKMKPEISLEDIAAATPGFVGADLKALTSEAAIAAVNRIVQKARNEGSSSEDGPVVNGKTESALQREVKAPALLDLSRSVVSEELLANICIEMEDFKAALKKVQPSAKREGFATVPDVTWDDIGSLRDIRAELERSIMLPIKHPNEFEMFGITAPAGILLCGPPGCGKTLLAKAVANEANINFISVKGPELLNMYVGESERAVRQCFQRAKNSQPCVIFFDEIDALCPKRTTSLEGQNATSRVVNQVLTEMDGVEGRQGVFLMAATNRPDMVDPAVLRPGRLDKILYVGFPNASDRADILRALTKNGTKPKLSDVDLDEIGNDKRLEGFTGADLSALVKEASLISLTRYIETFEDSKKCVTKETFTEAISKIRPSITPKQRERYEKLQETYSLPGGDHRLLNDE